MGRAGILCCWRDPEPKQCDSGNSSDTDSNPRHSRPLPKDLRNSIGFPKLVEKHWPSMPYQYVSKQEAGQNGRREMPRKMSLFDTKSWVRKSKAGRSTKGKSAVGAADLDGDVPPTPTVPEQRRPSLFGRRPSAWSENQNMDWSGLEFMKNIYARRKSVPKGPSRPGTSSGEKNRI